MNEIGKLERVPLREVWKHEAYDFTQWLEENIDVLNKVIGPTLVNVEREKKTESSFSVDLVAEDENGATVIIENQLEKSNHDHLGKVITYLTAMSAKSAIWIVSDPRPEHVSAIAWLNESTGVDFYLLKVEAVKIGSSPPAALLTVIVGPTEGFSEIRRKKQEWAERDQLRMEWWTKLVAQEGATLHAHITPGKYTWLGTSSGVRGLGLNYTVRKDDCGVELYIDRGRETEAINRKIFDHLVEQKDVIEDAFGQPLSWEALETKRACRIKCTLTGGGYRSDEMKWDKIQSEQVAAMTKLQQAIQPHLDALDLSVLESEIEEDDEIE